MAPPAPGRLSITTVCPSASDTGTAIILPRMSVPPPGAKGAIKRMGLVGYACAKAFGTTTETEIALIRNHAVFIFFPLRNKRPLTVRTYRTTHVVWAFPATDSMVARRLADHQRSAACDLTAFHSCVQRFRL